MPAKAKAHRAPKTARKKVWVHAFYLLQPFLQFFALVAVLFIFARCSPLAPSTDKSALKSSGPITTDTSSLAEAAALEEAFLNNLKELSVSEMEVISETEIEANTRSAPHVDEPMDESGIRTLFEKRNKKGVAGLKKPSQVLFLPLDQASQEAFFVNSVLRIDLSERIKGHTKEKARRLLFQHLQESAESKKIGATALLVMPDATMERVNGAFADLKLSIKISISIPSDDKAYLEIRRVDEAASHTQDNAVLLEAALKEATQLSILLE